MNTAQIAKSLACAGKIMGEAQGAAQSVKLPRTTNSASDSRSVWKAVGLSDSFTEVGGPTCQKLFLGPIVIFPSGISNQFHAHAGRILAALDATIADPGLRTLLAFV